MATTHTATHAPTNDTRYELVASAWTRAVFRARSAARDLEAGTVWA
jgi:acyl-CoA reductase-like NAD-dependent aldehyde dehydrogenase